MIVFDVSSLVGAAIKQDSVPIRAFGKALERDKIALSEAVEAEIREVLQRPRLARYIIPELCAELLDQLRTRTARFDPSDRVTDCRDPKDNKYLELALASRAEIIVSSDEDLLVLDPWRGVRILRPADYLMRP
ncbi:MAG: putative toxin-antitoxin system toxin component, PIN family [Alphaproteobacteria bacterium]|nr:putative toxin-antitoxin system toxin component, PIN family [Alphaproteobacteria bacterium]